MIPCAFHIGMNGNAAKPLPYDYETKYHIFADGCHFDSGIILPSNGLYIDNFVVDVDLFTNKVASGDAPFIRALTSTSSSSYRAMSMYYYSSTMQSYCRNAFYATVWQLTSNRVENNTFFNLKVVSGLNGDGGGVDVYFDDVAIAHHDNNMRGVVGSLYIGNPETATEIGIGRIAIAAGDPKATLIKWKPVVANNEARFYDELKGKLVPRHEIGTLRIGELFHKTKNPSSLTYRDARL